MKRKKAFTLLELSIVLAISSMMMIAAIKLFASMATNLTSGNNEMKMARVQNAISAFFAKNNRLPCPANPMLVYTDPLYGKESWDAGGHCNITFTTFNGASNVSSGFVNQTFSLYPDASYAGLLTNQDNRINFGMIPFKDMGLTEDEAHDAYSNKFTFITTRAYAGDRTIATAPIYKMFKGWTRVAMPARFYKHNIGCSATEVNAAAVNDGAAPTNVPNNEVCMERMSTNCQSASDATPLIITTLVAKGVYSQAAANARPDNAIATTCRMDLQDYNGNYISRENLAYALISHGKNGYGAWNKAGGLNQESASVKEKQNTFKYYHDTYPNHNISGVTRASSGTSATNSAIILVSSSKRDDFDDEVIFQTIDDLLLESGRNANVFCHQSTTFIDVLPTDVNNTMCMIWDMAMNTNNITRLVKMTDFGNAPPTYASGTPNPTPTCRAAGSMTLSCSAGGIWVNPT